MSVATTETVSLNPTRRDDAIAGVLLGMAVGDAIGLPWEGLSARRGRLFYGEVNLRHKFLLGRGMISDDTEHAAMTAQALLSAADDVERFRRTLAWRLRFWLLGMPAGIGLGTLRAIIRLWLGVPPTRSGVASAGNGPAMRAPIIGAMLADAPDTMRSILAASTQMTHRDPRAEQGALAIALAASRATIHGTCVFNNHEVLEEIQTALPVGEVRDALLIVSELLQRGADPAELSDALGTPGRVTGYMPHSVAAALFCWLRFTGEYQKSVESAVRLGGDTDTIAAIVGALVGAAAGPAAIPRDWLDGVRDWPRTVDWLQRLASRCADRFPAADNSASAGPLPLFWLGQLLRNVFFAAIVLLHGFRRLLPPY